jgi:hypothetical protein
MNVKADLRSASELALAQFLASGGTITSVKARKAPKPKMRGKVSREASKGTSGFATGFYSANALAPLVEMASLAE